jgi:wobble nucleotide-excising tRNase
VRLRDEEMIEKLEISGCASYGVKAEVMDDLSTFNYVYGPNGAGKTTVSRLIADHGPYSACKVHWGAGTILETMVYNRDFVARNFNQPTGLKGIFTLGAKDIDTLQKIADAKAEEDLLRQKLEGHNYILGGADGNGGKRADLAKVEQEFKEECWKLKTLHDPQLQGALARYRNDSQKFKDKLLAECAKVATQLLTQADLETRAASVFGPSPSVAIALPDLTDTTFLKWEVDPILKKKVLGKTDVDIAAMIQKLGNSDWVKQGVEYFEAGNGECPFCQQPTPEQLSASLAEYFDETFMDDNAAISALKSGYKLEGERLQQAMQSSINSNSPFLDIEKIKAEKAIFDSRLQLNLQSIERKHKEPSQIVSLEPLAAILTEVKGIIAAANQKIQAHNSMIANLGTEKQTLTVQVWAFLADSIKKTKLSKYQQAKSNALKAITGLENQIALAEAEKTTKQADIRLLEKSTTSIQPTVNEINKILNSFGFKNFLLTATSTGSLYTICRPDGSDAKDTLSEGERSFITFLYFYHLLRGSESSSGMTNDRVVVFDDPVSSLDSDILFIVGSLIKQVLEEVRGNKGHVKQVFVLTHNVYFHKEVTFNNKRKSGPLKEETFWTIRKLNGVSAVHRHDSNPIKTSYDLLWTEVRKPNLSSQTLQNTLRRILENYFRILGDMDTDDICNKFNGHEKLICRSLFSWVNDGSHSVHDDLYISADEKAMESFLVVFHKVFAELGHESHYKMMIGDSYVDFPETLGADAA